MLAVVMPWTPLDSTMLQAFDYDADMGVLHVRFGNGQTYSFRGVPADVAKDLPEADSAGQYFNKNIKGQFGSI